MTVASEEIEAMIDAAFSALAARHPECTSGDIDPGVLREVTQVLGAAARFWVTANTPDER